MRLPDLLGYCIQALRRNAFRTSMLLTAMAIGVAAVIVLTGLGEGARRYVLREFEALGPQTLIILPGRKETTGGLPPLTGEGTRDLTLADSLAIERLPQVKAVAPLVLGSIEASHGGRSRDVITIGTSRAFFAVRKLDVAQGQLLPALPLDEALPVAVLGRKVRDELFGDQPALGETLRLGNRRFRVIGILAESGEAMGMNRSEMIVITVASALQLFNAAGLFRVLVELTPNADRDHVRREITALLTARHEGEEDVTVTTQDALGASFDAVLSVLTAAVVGIAAISLLVAGVLVMNVTLITVSQRTEEIGLLKAIGASSTLVGRLFVTEAALLAGCGALIGVALGEALLALGRQLFPSIPFSAPAWAVVAAVAVALLTGLLFALMPARRAARLEPVAALTKRG